MLKSKQPVMVSAGDCGGSNPDIPSKIKKELRLVLIG